MENWFRDVGRTILVEALGDTCDRISNSFKTDFQAYTQDQLDLTTELETLRNKASQARRLEDENIALKDEIKALKDASREHVRTPSTDNHREAKSPVRTPQSPRSTDEVGSKWTNQVDIEGLTPPELKAEFLRLDKKHAKLYSKYLDLQGALHKSKEVLRDRTTTYHQWVDHAKQLGEQSLKRARRIKKLEARLAELSQEPLNLSFTSEAGDMEVVAEAATLTPIHPRQRTQSNALKQALVAAPQCQPRAPSHVDDTGRLKSPTITHSILESSHSASPSETGNLQKTVESTSCLPPLPKNREFTGRELHVKSEPSSDTPVVVLERSVRKRRHPAGDEADIPTYSKVKVEHGPGPSNIDKPPRFAPEESIDFDTEYHRVETPRKHTRHQHIHAVHLNDNINVQEHDYDTSIPHSLNVIRPTPHEPADDVSAMDLAAAICSEPQVNTASALQPLDHNQVLIPRSNSNSNGWNRKSSTMPRGLASLAEDSYQNENLGSWNSKNGPTVSVLEQLLNTPSPAQDARALQSGRPIEGEQSSNAHPQLPKRRELPFGKFKRKSLGPPLKGNPNASGYGPASPFTDQGHEKATVTNKTEKGKTGVPTLRQTPKTELRLDDFKINPHANEGYDYAFSDVVRKKDDRVCLQGCVKENCCGHKFRALAHAYRAGTRLYEFQSLLESYLGDDCHRLSIMSEAEKESLWVEAKIRELANANGKHRHRYPRMSTPPGFWRADFPSTQEGEEYNEEAAKLEREIIEERYREAMRPGGLWVFRDE
ncbi:hypothetical protein NUW58_g5621 [Xylaria curta]|uniref:Uncharacterized protein n=1 Tax=Xylaria curta TaxID=42375 RepID=A0ACC1P3E6_9PEZI|nr:hypothetical protein NUW58_g5621 [Xylaria curta]